MKFYYELIWWCMRRRALLAACSMDFSLFWILLLATWISLFCSSDNGMFRTSDTTDSFFSLWKVPLFFLRGTLKGTPNKVLRIQRPDRTGTWRSSGFDSPATPHDTTPGLGLWQWQHLQANGPSPQMGLSRSYCRFKSRETLSLRPHMKTSQAYIVVQNTTRSVRQYIQLNNTRQVKKCIALYITKKEIQIQRRNIQLHTLSYIIAKG